MDDNRKRSARNMSPGGGCKLIALRAYAKFDGSLVVSSESKYPKKILFLHAKRFLNHQFSQKRKASLYASL